jgi:DNA replication protein DnaC
LSFSDTLRSKPATRTGNFVGTKLVDSLYRGSADDSVGNVIESLLPADVVIYDAVGFEPLDDAGAQLLFHFAAAAYERRSLAVASHWPFDQWGYFLPNETTEVSLLDRLIRHSVVVVLTDGESFRTREVRQGGAGRTAQARPKQPGLWDFVLGQNLRPELGH